MAAPIGIIGVRVIAVGVVAIRVVVAVAIAPAGSHIDTDPWATPTPIATSPSGRRGIWGEGDEHKSKCARRNEQSCKPIHGVLLKGGGDAELGNAPP
jgi:hypothetical protein